MVVAAPPFFISKSILDQPLLVERTKPLEVFPVLLTMVCCPPPTVLAKIQASIVSALVISSELSSATTILFLSVGSKFNAFPKLSPGSVWQATSVTVSAISSKAGSVMTNVRSLRQPYKSVMENL